MYLTKSIESLGVHNHACMLYKKHAEQFSVVIPFIRIGMERGEKNMYISDDNTAQGVIDEMRRQGIDVDTAVKSGRLVIITKKDAYLKQGYFNPDWMIQFLKETTLAAISEGYPALRVAGEMDWALAGDPGAERLMEYEAKLNYFFPKYDCMAICQYDNNRFPSETVLDMIHTHPLVIHEKTICKNFYFMHPDAFLKKESTEDKADRFLENILGHARLEDEKEKLNAHVQQLQKMEAAGQLAGGVAHDFNNILTIIQNYSYLLLDSFPKEDTRRVDVEGIIESSKKAAVLTGQLIVFSRKQVLQTRAIDINIVLKDMQKMLRRLIGEGIEIEAVYDSKLENVIADRDKIEQVIMNLVINAHDAMPHGGRITVKTENITINEEQSKIMPDSKPGNYVRISVEDTGTGMDKDTIPHIFEPFFITKSKGKGTGLGLSITYGIIAQHEGFINVYSEKGKGSIFRVYLPSVMAKADKIEKKADFIHELKGKNETILFVEDEESIRKFVVMALTRNNYKVLEAEDVKQAIKIFKEEKNSIDMVFTDMMLPDSTGVKLIEQLQKMKPGIKVLISSGYLDGKSQLAGIREKGYKFIQKPYELDEILAAVAEVLNKK